MSDVESSRAANHAAEETAHALASDSSRFVHLRGHLLPAAAALDPRHCGAPGNGDRAPADRCVDAHRCRHNGARTVVSLFALLGLSNVIICSIGTVVLVRYRSLIPFMFGLFLLQHPGRQLILQFHPIARTGAPPGSAINLVILAVMIVGLALSLWRRNSLGQSPG